MLVGQAARGWHESCCNLCADGTPLIPPAAGLCTCCVTRRRVLLDRCSQAAPLGPRLEGRGLVGHRLPSPLRCQSTAAGLGKSCRRLAVAPLQAVGVASCSFHPPCGCILRGMVPGCPHPSLPFNAVSLRLCPGQWASPDSLLTFASRSLSVDMACVQGACCHVASPSSPAHAADEDARRCVLARAGPRGGGSEVCPGPGPPLLVWGSPGVLHLPAPGSGSWTQPLGCHLQPCPVSFSGVTRESRVTKGPGQAQ